MRLGHTAGPGKRGSAVRVIADRANRLHFALAKTEPDAVVAWRDNARWLIDGRVVSPSSPAFLLECLLRLDGIATVADLRSAWAALDEPTLALKLSHSVSPKATGNVNSCTPTVALPPGMLPPASTNTDWLPSQTTPSLLP